ncbi:hypothetical protein HUG17_7154 [Dermatophagoides farinae]|uniref:Uncharacterized protein n=1 Tax=Dermatophagoides farinae TaxID=6954 RepID=A0A9D4NRP6_DERFA|nr:nucleolar protein dao-5-like [Dermatophagoides farinae]XP_046913524.1 nucleolar protein dao-5-like [Dermatophagoides farinae]KAH7636948.1 hypothetical protein HUG17_7154 [Dermatophagoides farinae]
MADKQNKRTKSPSKVQLVKKSPSITMKKNRSLSKQSIKGKTAKESSTISKKSRKKSKNERSQSKMKTTARKTSIIKTSSTNLAKSPQNKSLSKLIIIPIDAKSSKTSGNKQLSTSSKKTSKNQSSTKVESISKRKVEVSHSNVSTKQSKTSTALRPRMAKTVAEKIKEKRSKSKLETQSVKEGKSKIQPKLFEKSKKSTKTKKDTKKQKSKTIVRETSKAAGITETILKVSKIEPFKSKPSSKKLELFVIRKSPTPMNSVEEQKSQMALLKAEAEAAARAAKTYEEPKFFETMIETKVATPETKSPLVEHITIKTTVVESIKADIKPKSSKPLPSPPKPASLPPKPASLSSKPASLPPKSASLSSKPLPSPSKPASLPPKPSSLPPKPASLPSKPASLPSKPLPIPSKPASLPPKPASLPSKPVSLSSKPASLPSKPASLPSKPKSLSSKPASLPSKPKSISLKPLPKPVMTKTPERFELKQKSVTIVKAIEPESKSMSVTAKDDQPERLVISTSKIATDDQQQPLFQTRTEFPLFIVSSVQVAKSKVSQIPVSPPQQLSKSTQITPKSTSVKTRTSYRSDSTRKSTYARFERTSIFYRRLNDYHRDRRDEAIMIPYNPYLKGRKLYTIHRGDELDQVIDITPGLMSSQSRMNSIRRSKTEVFRLGDRRNADVFDDDHNNKSISSEPTRKPHKMDKQQQQQEQQQQLTTTTTLAVKQDPMMKMKAESMEEPSILKTIDSCNSSESTSKSNV